MTTTSWWVVATRDFHLCEMFIHKSLQNKEPKFCTHYNKSVNKTLLESEAFTLCF